MTTKSKQLVNEIRELGRVHVLEQKKKGVFFYPAEKIDINFLSKHFEINRHTLLRWLSKKSEGVPLYMHETIEKKLSFETATTKAIKAIEKERK